MLPEDTNYTCCEKKVVEDLKEIKRSYLKRILSKQIKISSGSAQQNYFPFYPQIVLYVLCDCVSPRRRKTVCVSAKFLFYTIFVFSLILLQLLKWELWQFWLRIPKFYFDHRKCTI